MKSTIVIALICLFVSSGCTKEPFVNSVALPPPAQQPPILNTPPKVSAVSNIQLYFPVDSCILIGAVTASGSRIKTYLWEKTNGPAAYKIEHPDSLITTLHALQEGTYTFQLTVTDSSGLTGKTAVIVSVTSISAFEYNLDLNFNTEYKFFKKAENGNFFDPYYADQTIITASVQLSASDYLQVDIYEETDTAAQAYYVNHSSTGFRLTNQLYASGPSVFNLKKTIQQGGGIFSGTIQLNSSSALRTGREAPFMGLPPLTVTGKLDTTSHTVNIQIKGKIIF